MRRATFVLFWLTAVLCSHAAPDRAPIRYNRDIRPILSENCFACHGADKSSRKARLRLDEREAAIEKEAIVPGKPEESELFRRVTTTNEDDIMPPADTHKKLLAADKEKLRQWIAEGAAYEAHWSFIPPVRPPVPDAGGKSPRRNPIDAFVLTQLNAHKIKPSPAADRRTLLRRLSLDLIGLPPSHTEMTAFLSDDASGAYGRQVERLLASPHFGERMAVPWLDVVRYADTIGYHGDQNVNVFPYRDYVINAFNSNKRFDQFTLEQIAGDLLPNPTVEQRVATGFNRLNMVTREGGAQPKEYLAKYGADRVRTVGMAWMGLTVGCAECHDHKFDPVSTKDFYQLKAFFSDVRQWGVYSDYRYTPNPDLKGWDNEHPFPPEEVVSSPFLERRLARLRREIGELAVATVATNRAAFEQWTNSVAKMLAAQSDSWSRPVPIVSWATNITYKTNKVMLTNIVASTDSSPAVTNVETAFKVRTNTQVITNLVIEAESRVLLTGHTNAPPIQFAPAEGAVAALKLELLPHSTYGGSIFRGKGKAMTLQLSATLRRAGSTNDSKLSFYFADAEIKAPRYANGAEVIGIKDGWKLAREQGTQAVTGFWLLDPPVQVNAGDLISLSFRGNPIGALRVSVAPFANENPIHTDAAESVASALRGHDDVSLANAWLASAGPADAFAQYKSLHRQVLECRDGKSPTVVTVAWKPEPTRVLPRGNWQSDDGELVEPATPHFLPAPERNGTNHLTRLDLARWLVAPENPLTARTVMNRLWKQFFGSGLANPVDDLGLQGEVPSHPELLDWLAVEFRDSGWDLKHMVRLLVTSQTYQQKAEVRADLREVDPNNRMLAAQNPRRLDAEFVRDNALAISGLLNLEIGGPSAFPYQPAGYYVNLQFPDRDYVPSRDDRQYRRGLYSHWQRTFLQPMLANFDAPSREECTAIRTVSNTPQQALTLLNDPTFVEAARVWAVQLLQSKVRSDDQRLQLAFEHALGRPISRAESKSLKAFLASQRKHLQEHKEEPAKLQKVGLAPTADGLPDVEVGAWTAVCRVILNLHETITIY